MTEVTFCAYDSPNSVGGPTSWLVRMLPALRDFDIETRCLFLTWGNSGSAVTQLKDMGITALATPCRGTTEERIKWILEQLREKPPHVFVPNLVVPAYFAARWVGKAGIPTVGILHSDDNFYRAIQKEFVFGRPPYAVTSVVCVSRELEHQVTRGKPRHSSVQRIAYGVPVPAERARRKNGRFRIAYVGRLAEKQKQISQVARALCQAVRLVPGTEAVIYGDGPDRGNVEQILATEGQGLPVHLGGIVPIDQIQDKLLQCDVIVLLSDYEGLPISILEAMACGVVPVCLRMRSGIPELIENSVTGLLVQDRVDDFVAAIRTLKDDIELWNKLSASARKKIEDEYSITKCAEQWAELFHSLHRDSRVAKRIVIPGRFSLPPLQSEFSAEDPRTVLTSVAKRFYSSGRKLAGLVRRKVSENL